MRGGEPATETAQCPIQQPHHVAVIMDGNGRWARIRGWPRTEGHRRGAAAVRRIVRAARERDITNLTLFALSTQNLSRPANEVRSLFGLLRRFMLKEAEEMRSNGIRFRLMGDPKQLPDEVADLAQTIADHTARCQKMTLTLAVAYGGQEDLVAGLQSLMLDEGGEPVTAKRLEEHLWSAHLPPVDLLIRTGGERRISNFLLWHLAYAELHFTDILWPDFKVADLDRAMQEFVRRDRRYGQVPSLKE